MPTCQLLTLKLKSFSLLNFKPAQCFYFLKRETKQKEPNKANREQGEVSTQQSARGTFLPSTLLRRACWFFFFFFLESLRNIAALLHGFSVCRVSASVLHNPECPLIPCLIVLGLFIFQNPVCSGANSSVTLYLILQAPAQMFLKFVFKSFLP